MTSSVYYLTESSKLHSEQRHSETYNIPSCSERLQLSLKLWQLSERDEISLSLVITPIKFPNVKKY
jgi:hypothetical protein